MITIASAATIAPASQSLAWPASRGRRPDGGVDPGGGADPGGGRECGAVTERRGGAANCVGADGIRLVAASRDGVAAGGGRRIRIVWSIAGISAVGAWLIGIAPGATWLAGASTGSRMDGSVESLAAMVVMAASTVRCRTGGLAGTTTETVELSASAAEVSSPLPSDEAHSVTQWLS